MHSNRVLLYGTLANDPSVVFTERGTQQASFALLLEEPGQGEQVFRTYIPCQAYGKSVERVGELSQGATVLVDGKLSWRAGSKDGTKPGRLEVFAQSVEGERAASMAASAN
jgi:single-stranded DNA-binding protein